MMTTATNSFILKLYFARPVNIRAGRARSVTSLPKIGLCPSEIIDVFFRGWLIRI